jgi:hypothetical protein
MRITEVKISDASIRSTLEKYEPFLRNCHTAVQFMNLLLRQPVALGDMAERSDTKFSSLYQAINSSFTFVLAPQRGDFWYNLSDSSFGTYMLSHSAQKHISDESIKLMVAADTMLTQLKTEPTYEGRLEVLRGYLGDGLFSHCFTAGLHEVGYVFLGCVRSESLNEAYDEVRTFCNGVNPLHVSDEVLDLKAAMTLLKATGKPPIALLIQNKHTPSYPENSPISFEGRFSGLERVDTQVTQIPLQ